MISSFVLAPPVAKSLKSSAPVVALESALITHGFPRPDNLEISYKMEAEVLRFGATPATIAVLDGMIRVGLSEAELQRFANLDHPQKISYRDFAAVHIKTTSGGTTVAGTLFAAARSGLKVLATGGIGGVHRGTPFDISTDLRALAETPMIVVCAGAKAILDLPATMEVLEGYGVPVVGYQTDEFPAFYSRETGLPVSCRLNTVSEIVGFAQAHWSLGFMTAILVGNPIPADDAISIAEVELLIIRAQTEAKRNGIHGQGLTPHLLQSLNKLSNGKTLKANSSLLLNNARLAGQIAVAMSTQRKSKSA